MSGRPLKTYEENRRELYTFLEEHDVNFVRLNKKWIQVRKADLETLTAAKSLYETDKVNSVIGYRPLKLRPEAKPLYSEVEYGGKKWPDRYKISNRIENPYSCADLKSDIEVPIEISGQYINKYTCKDVPTEISSTPVDISDKGSEIEHLKFNVININLRDCLASKLLQLSCLYPEVQIFGLNEIKLDITRMSKLSSPGYKLVASDACSRGYAYSAFLIRDDIFKNTKKVYSKPPFIQVEFKSEIENAASIRFTSLYKPNRGSIKWTDMGISEDEFFIRLARIANQTPVGVIMGDFNTHFDKKTDSTRRVNSTLSSLRNIVKMHTFQRTRKGKIESSQIDGVFISGLKGVKLTHLELAAEIGTDGHNGQLVNFSFGLTKTVETSWAFSRQNANDEFIYNLSTDFLPFFRKAKSIPCVVERLERYTDLFSKMVELAEPETLVQRPIFRRGPCLSKNSYDLKDRMIALRRANHQSPSSALKEALSEARKLFAKSANFDHLNRFGHHRIHRGPMTLDEVHKLNKRIATGSTADKCPFSCNQLADHFTGLQEECLNYGLDSETETIEIDIDALLRDQDEKRPNRKMFAFKEVTWEGVLHPSRSNSVREVLKNFKLSTRDHTGLSANFILACSAEMSEFITDAVNSALLQGTYINPWKLTRLVAIPKKGNLKEIKNWRPIVVTHVIAMITQKVAVAQLSDYIAKRNILNTVQHGFQSKIGTSTAILEFTTCVFESEKNDPGLAAFYDAKAAFVSPLHTQIVKKLSTFCNRTVLSYFTQFLTEQKFFVESNGYRSTVRTAPACGVGQGSAPGPVLFNLVYDDVISDVIEIGKCKFVAFADDLSCLVRAPSWTKARNRVENVSAILFERMKKRANVRAAQQKTEVLTFGKSSKSTVISCDFGGQICKSADDVRYLGVNFSSDLELECHFKRLAGRIYSEIAKHEKLTAIGSRLRAAMCFLQSTEGMVLSGLSGQFIKDSFFAKVESARMFGLKQILKRQHFQTGRHLSNVELLNLGGGARSLKNGHLSNSLTQLSKIFQEQKPKYLYIIYIFI